MGIKPPLTETPPLTTASPPSTLPWPSLFLKLRLLAEAPRPELVSISPDPVSTHGFTYLPGSTRSPLTLP